LQPPLRRSPTPRASPHLSRALSTPRRIHASPPHSPAPLSLLNPPPGRSAAGPPVPGLSFKHFCRSLAAPRPGLFDPYNPARPLHSERPLTARPAEGAAAAARDREARAYKALWCGGGGILSCG
jgi:hypothetical protein